jgi:large subunit ribosomal protein L4
LGNVLIIVEALDEKLLLASRNLPHVELIEVAQINPLSLVDHERVLMTVAAVKLLEQRFQ